MSAAKTDIIAKPVHRDVIQGEDGEDREREYEANVVDDDRLPIGYPNHAPRRPTAGRPGDSRSMGLRCWTAGEWAGLDDKQGYWSRGELVRSRSLAGQEPKDRR